jgi:excisionase family DNA binding protein
MSCRSLNYREPLLSIPEAARRIGVSTLVFRRVLERGELEHLCIGRRKRIAVSELESYLRRVRVRTAA